MAPQRNCCDLGLLKPLLASVFLSVEWDRNGACLMELGTELRSQVSPGPRAKCSINVINDEYFWHYFLGEGRLSHHHLQMRKVRPELPGLGSSGVQEQRQNYSLPISGPGPLPPAAPFSPEGWACWASGRCWDLAADAAPTASCPCLRRVPRRHFLRLTPRVCVGVLTAEPVTAELLIHPSAGILAEEVTRLGGAGHDGPSKRPSVQTGRGRLAPSTAVPVTVCRTLAQRALSPPPARGP